VIGPGAAAYASEADLLLPLPAALTESQGALPALLALRLLARHLAAAAQPPRGVARV
jgi:hypothetical protein